MKVENGRIISLQIGRPKEEVYLGNSLSTGIDKRKVDNIEVKDWGIIGDEVANKKFHGGPDRAICFYPYENYAYWKREFSKELVVPAFGENITVSGMGENHVYIGDIYRVGDCMIQISQGRVPCSTISLFNNESKLLKEAVNTCLTGYFARVINPGTIKETNQVILERRLQEEVTVLYGNRVVLHGEDGIEGVDRVLCVPGLSTEWRNLLMKKKKKYQFHTL